MGLRKELDLIDKLIRSYEGQVVWINLIIQLNKKFRNRLIEIDLEPQIKKIEIAIQQWEAHRKDLREKRRN